MNYGNWLSSKEKWEKIVKNIRNRNKYDGGAFYDIKVESSCGYCDEYDEGADCRECPLIKHDLCNYGGSCGAFFDCVFYLRAGKHKAALPLAKKILAFIINDEPESTNATK